MKQTTCAAIGEGNILIYCLKELLRSGLEINVVFTNTECAQSFCAQEGIPVHNRNADLANVLSRFETDYLFSISNPRILKDDVLRLPKKQTINYHDSPLPAYAGVHATSWAIANGERMHGVSWHIVEVGIDTGDILQSEIVEIDENDSALTLNLKCVEASKRAFCRLVNDILCDDITQTKQQDVGRTYFGLYAIPKNVGLLRFTDDTNSIFNLARSLELGHNENSLGTPKIKTCTGDIFLVTNIEKSIKSVKCGHIIEPGEIIAIVHNTMTIATKDQCLELSASYLDGTPLPISAFQHYGLVVGNTLSNEFDIDVSTLIPVRKKETFWRRKLGLYEPTMFYRQKMNVVASIIDVAQNVSLRTVEIELPDTKYLQHHHRINESNLGIQALFVAFLARITCTSVVNIGLLAEKDAIAIDAQDIYANIVPGVFDVDIDACVDNLLDKTVSKLQETLGAKTFLSDVFYRYPELRGHKRLPHHNLVLASGQNDLSDTKVQEILFDCNALLFFNDHQHMKIVYHERPVEDLSHVTSVLQHFGTFLEAASNSNGNLPLKNVTMISENEKSSLYHIPPEAGQIVEENNISMLVDCQCNLTPFSIAVRTTKGMMTYKKLSEQIDDLTEHLVKDICPTGHEHGKPVIGLHMGNTVPYVVSVLAVAKSNLAFLPLPLDLPTERLCFTLQDANVCQVLMTKDKFHNCNFNGMTSRMSILFEHNVHDETIVLVYFGDSRYDEEYSDHDVNCSRKDVSKGSEKSLDFLYLMYTSGSTGRPKGVKVKESSVVNLARAQITCWDIVPGDVVAQFASIGFDASISEIFIAMLSGASLAVLDSSERLGTDFASAMTKMKVTTVTLPPSALNIYSPDDMPHLTKVISAGEACTLQNAVKWTTTDIRFFNAYGPTEGTVCATCYEFEHGSMTEDINHDLPIGKGIDGVYVYLLDDFMQPVPADVVGELYIGGRGLAHGYIGHAASLTDMRFVQNPLVTHKSLLYKTGDHAFQDSQGNFTYIGRTDDQVKIRGHRIDLSEIEQVLIQHPKIDMAVVVVHKCSLTNDSAVAAYVAPSFIYISELREYLTKVLPKYMVPTYIKKLEVKDLPKSVNGKVNRKKLELDESLHKSVETEGHSHLNDTQLMIARLWCQVYNFDESFIYSLHRQSSFSELGGNSLHLVLLMRLIEDETKLKFSFTDLGTADTIDEFADVIRRRRDMKSEPNNSDLKTQDELRDMIFHDSELPKSLFPNLERRRSIQKDQPTQIIPTPYIIKTQPRNVLLSGVTGFLGAFLLTEILEQSKAHVCCMVRESTEARGIGRIIDNMRKYGLWKFEYISRIAVVLSDLSEENLGIAPDIYRSLCNAIDVVFMNAAMMNFNTPYEDHRMANVLGTKEFIKFATTGLQKYLFTTSSLSVFLFPPEKIENGKLRRMMKESDFFDDPLLIEGGYGQSKWASERLVMQAIDLLPGGAIFRPARVSGRSTDGVGPKNDLFASTIIGMKKMGSYPDMDFPYDLTPVDFCARSMIEVMLNVCAADPEESPPKVYHLFNHDTIPFRDLFDGMDLERLPLEEWRTQLRKLDADNKELLPLTPFFMSKFWDRAPDWPVFDTSNVDNSISDNTKHLLKPTKELLLVYKQFFKEKSK